MHSKTIICLLSLAVLTPFLYDRVRFVKMMFTNAPQRLKKINTFKDHAIVFSDQIRSCEDSILLEEHGLAILACDAGRERWNTVLGLFYPGLTANSEFYAYNYTGLPGTLRKLEVINFTGIGDFHTLGIAYDKETSTIYATNHARSGPKIETFKLNLTEATATHMQTIEHPLLHTPNSIEIVGNNEIYVTNDHYFTMKRSRILSQLETYLSFPTGTVVHVNVRHPDGAKVVARLPYANGIQILNTTTVAISSTSRGAVFFYKRHGKVDLRYHSQIKLPYFPDNLSLSAGSLLIAGHAHAPSLIKFAKSRHICNDAMESDALDLEMKEYCKNGTTTSWVSQWSEGKGIRHLYVDTEYPSSTTAIRDAKRGLGFILGLYAKGVLVWKE